MQKVYLIIVLVLGSFCTRAQLVFNENFTGYTNGNLGTQGLWIQSGTGTDVQVASSTPLTYPGYGSGTKYINVASVDGTDPYKMFSTGITTNPNRIIFFSFVVRVSSARKLNLGPDSSITLRNSTDPDIPLRFYIAENIANTGIQFGIQIGSNTIPQFTIGTFQYNTTYLIAIRYDIQSGNNNDDAYLWVNPSNYPAEPSISPLPSPANNGASIINGAENNYGNTIDALQIIQSNDLESPDAAFDGLKVAHSTASDLAWGFLNPALAALPVDLKSFKAINDNNSVRVSWEVGIEDNVKGYEIQRSKDGVTFEAIAFVDAAGKATYSFTDDRPLAGSNFYRVVTIDNDRRLKYSSIVSINGRKDFYLSKFPNPTTNTLIVQHQEVSSEDAILRVTSFDGKVVNVLRLALNSVQTNIDVSTLRTGNYLLEFVNGGKRISTTFIKR